jgi:ribonuclease HI
MDFPWDFFDGYAQGVPSKRGVGGILHLSNTHSIYFSIGLGTTSNNFNELMDLHLILQLA